MKIALLLLFVVAVNADGIYGGLSLFDSFTAQLNVDLLKADWENFKVTHDKDYDDESEETIRMKIFTQNRFKIAQHNEQFEKGVESYYMAMNKFGDMLPHEFTNVMAKYNATQNMEFFEDAATYIAPELEDFSDPKKVDWRSKGIVTNVKDQGQCGSCWSFAATGALEGQNARKTHRLISLSEQNLIDCSSSYGNKGCDGGFIHQAFRYIHDNRGIDTEKSYPYEFRQGRCRYNPRFSAAKVANYKLIPKSEQTLKRVVATMGPVAVALDATNFQFYRGGVFFDRSCSESRINHAVLVVGYGSDNRGGDYWLIKNSWATSWGEQGYMKLARNRGNHCGVASYGVIPQV